MRERTGAQSGSALIAQAVAEGLVKPQAKAPGQALGVEESRFAAGARTRRVGLAGSGADGQDVVLERAALVAGGCCRIFEEEAGTGNLERPGLAAAINFLRQGDMLVMWRIARLGPSIGELLDTVGCLYELGAGVAILDGDLSGEYTPEGDGKLLFTIAAALADLRPNESPSCE
jgi:hypothetical protein